jgi:hypothetical protein
MEEHPNALRSKVCRFIMWVLVFQIFIYCTLLRHDTKNKINHILGKKKKANYAFYKQKCFFSSSPYLRYSIGLGAGFITVVHVDNSFVLMC